MSTAAKTHLTPERYLEIERAADFRSEFYRGEMFAMTGASRRHNLIAVNLSRFLSNRLDGRKCEVYQSDMRVKVEASGLYTYPDVVVTCQQPQFEDDVMDTLLNPQVIFEVLSDSTEQYDRGKKFGLYRQIKSLKQYFLITQDSQLVEKYTRQDDDQWLMWDTSKPKAQVAVEAADCVLAMAEIYLKVDFDDEGQTSGQA